MKKSLRSFFVLGAAAITLFTLVSCQSTNQEKGTENSISSNSAKASVKSQLENMKITVVSSPKETVKGKAFAAPYKILVTNLEDVPYASLNITVEYPSSKTAGTLSFEHETLVTDENGNATFTPQVPQFSTNSQVSFYPQVQSSNPQIAKLCSAVTASAAWKVRTSTSARTGILVSIVDYNQNGKIGNLGGAQLSTQALEKVLWRSGLTGAQNADFHNAIEADDPARIRSDALRLVRGNSSFVYVVYGRVKYASQITKDADGFFNVTFTGDMGVLNINTGEVLLKTAKTVTVKDKTEWKLITLAQDEMAKLFGEEIIYGL